MDVEHECTVIPVINRVTGTVTKGLKNWKQ